MNEELTARNAHLQKDIERVSADLRCMSRLHEMSTRLAGPDELPSLLDDVVRAAAEITGGDMCHVHLVDGTGALTIAAQSGFQQPFLDFFARVVTGTDAAYDAALATRGRVIVDDVTESPLFLDSPSLNVLLTAGVQALQLTPLVSRSGELVGMFSTHYRTARNLEGTDLRWLDLLARQAADFIERRRLQDERDRTNEQALHESRLRYTLATAAGAVGVWDWNLETNDMYVDPKLKSLLGYEDAEIPNRLDDWGSRVHPQDVPAVMAQAEACIKGDTDVYEMEHRMVHKDGGIRWFLARGSVMRRADGTPHRMVGTDIDITERRRAEHEKEDLMAQLVALNTELEERVDRRTSELTGALKEREILLKEVHHRVKNNLQVISSLLNMQARTLEDGASRDAVEACQTRVQAIALIHEKLYQSEDYSRVPFSPYARSLANSVFQAISVSPSTVSLDLAIEDVVLAVDKAIPCGLLINELITNALKHGFKAGQPGTVRVELATIGSGRLRLAVTDDGVGVPEGLDIRKSASLGLQLVSTLAEQLDAKLEVSGHRGTSIQLTFPVEA